jgi:hypothetical protein
MKIWESKYVSKYQNQKREHADQNLLWTSVNETQIQNLYWTGNTENYDQLWDTCSTQHFKKLESKRHFKIHF